MNTLKAQKALRLPVSCLAGVVGLLLCLAPGARGQQDTIHVGVTFYDFRSDRTNPEFEQPHGKDRNVNGRISGMVEDTLDADEKPIASANGHYLNQGIRFWFRDWNSLSSYTQRNHPKGRTDDVYGTAPATRDYLTKFRPIYTYKRKGGNGFDVLPPGFRDNNVGEIDGDEWDARFDYRGNAYGAGNVTVSTNYNNSNNSRTYTIDTAYTNRVLKAQLVFTHYEGGVYRFECDHDNQPSRGFYPLTNRTGPGTYNNPNGNRNNVIFTSGSAFTDDDWVSTGERNYNWSYTMEMKREFKMTSGLKFEFVGDDDLWLFINRKLVNSVDLGGIHERATGRVDLDENLVRNRHGLEEGKMYDFHLFYSERHSNGSNIKIMTNMVSSRLDSMKIKVSSDPMKAGEPKLATAEIVTDTGVLKDYTGGTFAWSARDEGGYNTTANGNLVINNAKTGTSTGLTQTDSITVTAKKAYTWIWIKGRYTNAEGQSVEDSVRVWVGPGKGTQISIEASPDSTEQDSKGRDRRRERCDLDTVVISSGQAFVDNFFAIVRDEFGNWVTTANTVEQTGRTITWTEENAAIATLDRNGAVGSTPGPSRGQGKANRVSTESGFTPFTVTYVVNDNSTLSPFNSTDGAVIKLDNATYDAIRVGVKVGGQFIEISSLDMVVGADTTLWVQMRRSDDNTKWEERPANWTVAGGIPGVTGAQGVPSLRVTPTGAGDGTITATIPGTNHTKSIPISVVNRNAAAMRIFDKTGTPDFSVRIADYDKDAVSGKARAYADNGTNIQRVEVRAGVSLPLTAKMFSDVTPDAASWLSHYEGPGGGGAQWTWRFLPGSATGELNTTTNGFENSFRSTVAHTTYEVGVTFRLGQQTLPEVVIRIAVIPDYTDTKLVIEPDDGTGYKPGTGVLGDYGWRKQDTLNMATSDQLAYLYAVIRDRYGNWVGPASINNPYISSGYAAATNWTSPGPKAHIVEVNRGNWNETQDQGKVEKPDSTNNGNGTWVKAHNSTWASSDSVWVELLGYDYSGIIIVGKCKTGGNTLITIAGQPYCEITDTLTMTSNDDEDIYVVYKRNDCDDATGKNTTDGGNCYESGIPGDWDRSSDLVSALTPPGRSSTWRLSPRSSGEGKITVTRPGTDMKDSIFVKITVGPPLSAELVILTPAAQIKAGQPITAEVVYYNRAGRMTEWDPSWTGPTANGSVPASSLAANFTDNVGIGLAGEKGYIPKVLTNGWNGDTTLYNPDRPGAGFYNAGLANPIGKEVVFIIYNANEGSPHEVKLTQTIHYGDKSVTVTPSVRFVVNAGDAYKIEIESNKLENDTLRLAYTDPDEVVRAVAYDEYGNRVGEYPVDWHSDNPVVVDNKGVPVIVYSPKKAESNGVGELCVTTNVPGLNGDCIWVSVSGVTIYARSLITRDYDGCGYLDAIELKFPKGIDLTQYYKELTPNEKAAFHNTIIVSYRGTRIAVDNVTARPQDSTAVIHLVDVLPHSGDLQTGWRPDVTIPDSVFFEADYQVHTSITDGAAPVIATAKLYFPSSGTGNIKENYIEVKFSEDVRAPEGSFRDNFNRYAPEQLFSIWELSAQGKRLAKSKSKGALAKAAADPNADRVFDPLTTQLSGIKDIHYVNESTLRFYLENEKELGPPRHYINIKANNNANPMASVWDVVSNVPKDNNRKVAITYGNEPNAKAVAIPNPASPDGSRVNGNGDKVSPGVIFATHDPTAIRDIQGGNGGTVVRTPVYVPNTGKIRCQIKVYDLAGNLVISGESDRAKEDLLRVNSAVAGTFADLDIYWNGFNSKAMKVSPGTYRMVVYISYTGINNSNTQDAQSAKNRKYQTTVGMSK